MYPTKEKSPAGGDRARAWKVYSQNHLTKPAPTLQDLFDEVQHTFTAKLAHFEPDLEFDRRHIALRKACLALQKYNQRQRRPV